MTDDSVRLPYVAAQVAPSMSTTGYVRAAITSDPPTNAEEPKTIVCSPSGRLDQAQPITRSETGPYWVWTRSYLPDTTWTIAFTASLVLQAVLCIILESVLYTDSQQSLCREGQAFYLTSGAAVAQLPLCDEFHAMT